MDNTDKMKFGIVSHFGGIYQLRLGYPLTSKVLIEDVINYLKCHNVLHSVRYCKNSVIVEINCYSDTCRQLKILTLRRRIEIIQSEIESYKYF